MNKFFDAVIEITKAIDSLNKVTERYPQLREISDFIGAQTKLDEARITILEGARLKEKEEFEKWEAENERYRREMRSLEALRWISCN